ncbi:MAG: efflux RND transporter permease subunit [Pseudomonadota bacterium]
MSGWSIFVHRPIATSLLTLAIALPGILAFWILPIASLPNVDMPSISVTANLPGASPETMASSVATPLERSLGRIAGITEITSRNTQGTTNVDMQFELSKDINTAAREVQAAINAAQANLPIGMLTRPSYRKSSAAGAPIMSMALTSAKYTREQLYDFGFTLMSQQISQVPGVGDVVVNGSALRSVRIHINPTALGQYGISLDQVRLAIAASNANRPTGFIEDSDFRWQINVNDKAHLAKDFQDLIIATQQGAAIRLSDVAEVIDSVQEFRNAGSSRGKPAVMVVVFNEPGANIVDIVDEVKALLPRLQAQLPPEVDVEIVIDRSITIRKTLAEVEHTLLIAIALVILVTYLFLRDARATIIPTIIIPATLLASLAVIYLCGFSLNNLSLMALIISTSFIVDDAIVVVENVKHHIERGLTPINASLQAVREVGFTLLAMNIALIAVLVPLLFMGGVMGRLFREFSVTLAIAIAISLLLSVTATPSFCSRILKAQATKPVAEKPSKKSKRLIDFYAHSLRGSLRCSGTTLLLFFCTILCSIYCYSIIPKGFFPQQDTGRIQGRLQIDQSASFAETRKKIHQLMAIVGEDPAIDTYYEFTGGRGGGTANTGSMFSMLKPVNERDVSAQEIVNRLRPKLAQVPGASLFLLAQQDLNFGARPGGAQYQFTLLSDDINQLRQLVQPTRTAMEKLQEITDVNADYDERGLQLYIDIHREKAASLGVTVAEINNTLNNAFGQRVVSTLYEPLNQYFVVLTLAPEFAKNPQSLEQIYVFNNNNEKIPLATVASWSLRNAPLTVNHQEQFAAITLSFNLAKGIGLQEAMAAIQTAFASLNPPNNIRGVFAGSAKIFQDSLASQPWLILAAVVSVFIVLGILYESTLHPLTILSTLPSAGLGALIVLMLSNTEFTLIALIGVILVVGIVMKNAIIMIDCALQIERNQNVSAEAAIYQACLTRFRPILMTSIASILGALPLALGSGDGAELRRPLGLAIIGGLILGQVLTLYTTPVVYVYLDKLRRLQLRNIFSKAFLPRQPGNSI